MYQTPNAHTALESVRLFCFWVCGGGGGGGAKLPDQNGKKNPCMGMMGHEAKRVSS